MTLATGKNKNSTRLKFFFIIGWSELKLNFLPLTTFSSGDKIEFSY